MFSINTNSTTGTSHLNTKQYTNREIKKVIHYPGNAADMAIYWPGYLEDFIDSGIEKQKIIDLIFQECPLKNLPTVLHLIREYLSPYDKIREAIANDQSHQLNNSSIITMFQEAELEMTENRMQGCCDIAYRMGNLAIYQVPDRSVLEVGYTINFLWINLNRQNDEARHIFGDGLNPYENDDRLQNLSMPNQEEAGDPEDLEKMKKTFTYKLLTWVEANPDARQINLWYDRALVTERARQNTLTIMNAIAESKRVDLRLRDVRQIVPLYEPSQVDTSSDIGYKRELLRLCSLLPTVNQELECSLHPAVPVYFRVDLMKALITDHMISYGSHVAKYFVFSDIDVEPMTSQQLFDQRTVNFLSSKGYVFNGVAGGSWTFENSFFIFDSGHEKARKIHNEVLLRDPMNEISDERYNTRKIFNRCLRIRGLYKIGSESIYMRYIPFLEKMGDCAEDSDKRVSWKKYPRKLVRCPMSQFSNAEKSNNSNFSMMQSNQESMIDLIGQQFQSMFSTSEDHRKEKCHFAGPFTTPHVIDGRGGKV